MSAGGKEGGQRSGNIETAAELFSRAYEMEVEAGARYLELADQMEVHNNPDVAAMFRHFARAEEKHAAEIAERMREKGIAVEIQPDFDWPGQEGPETVDTLDVHYRMTAYHALELALGAEQRAFEFFDAIARNAGDDEVRAWAKEFADEEAAHVRYIENALKREKKPDDDWATDFDAPVVQE